MWRKKNYISSYNQTDPELADIIIPIGGDGILLKSLHDFNKLNKPFFGINLWLCWLFDEFNEVVKI